MSDIEEEDAFFKAIMQVKIHPAIVEEEMKAFLKSANTWLFELELKEEKETYNF